MLSKFHTRFDEGMRLTREHGTHGKKFGITWFIIRDYRVFNLYSRPPNGKKFPCYCMLNLTQSYLELVNTFVEFMIFCCFFLFLLVVLSYYM